MTTRPPSPLLLSAFTATSCIGHGSTQTIAALHAGRSGLGPCDFETVDLPTWIGKVDAADAQHLPAELRRYECRNNRLAELAYRQRNPVDGSLPDTFDYGATHNAFSLVDYVRRRLGLEGPAAALSSACASSAKAFAAGRRMIDAGIIDAALVGGVDSLCLTTLYGFHSLQLLSPDRCKPFDRQRDGLSIGEAAAFALLERAPGSADRNAVMLLGVGESNDAHHMSAPHPDGLGARLAIEAALADAGLTAADIDYVNLHGTGTPSNDRAESLAVGAVFGSTLPCSSTKGATGHTLGAAGALEAVISAWCLQESLLPGGLHIRHLDPELAVNYLTANRRVPARRMLSNSFGFGGVNC